MRCEFISRDSTVIHVVVKEFIGQPDVNSFLQYERKPIVNELLRQVNSARVRI